MNKLFDDIRSIAHSEIEKLKLNINESLDKLCGHSRPIEPRTEDKVPAKRTGKHLDQETQKKNKIDEERSHKAKQEELFEPRELKEPKDSSREKETREHRDNKDSIDKKDLKEHKDRKEIKYKEAKARENDYKQQDERKVEEIHEKPQKPASSEKLEKPEKGPKKVNSKPISIPSDSDSAGLGSSGSESDSLSEADPGHLPEAAQELSESAPKPSKLSDLSRTRENLSTVIKALDDPGDRFEEIFDFFISVIEGSDQDLKDRVHRINWAAKIPKDFNFPSDIKSKIKKILKSIPKQPNSDDQYKDLEIIKMKLDGAIKRKCDLEISGIFKRFEDILKDNLTLKEVPLLRETSNLLEGLLKSSKNGEIRKTGHGLKEKIDSKIDGLARKRNYK